MSFPSIALQVKFGLLQTNIHLYFPPAILERALFHSTNAYFIPTHIFAVSYRTNLPPSTAMRGFGGPQAMLAIKSAIAKLAATLGISREEIQAKNLLASGDPFPYGQQLQSDNLQKTWETAIQSYDLAAIRDRVASTMPAILPRSRAMPSCPFALAFPLR